MVKERKTLEKTGRCFYRKSPCIEWTGEWVDDNWLIGVVTWLADGTFIGRWNHINSTFVRDNGDDYCGELSFDGIAHGYGVMNYINGSCYRGMWREGWRWGLGILTYPDGCKYESEWTAGSLYVNNLLIRHGANVNHCILSKSTPMRVACYNGRIDIVKYLVDNGGDIKLVNAYDSTCLMIAAYRGHTELCRYLLGIGAEINAKDKEGSTPLHYACETNNLDLVKLLINSGAVNSKNLNGVTPLHIAASEPRPSIVEYFVNKSDYCSKIEQVEALELQAASYCNHTTATYDISKVYEYLFQAMQLRHADPEQPILKAYQQPLPIFNNQLECQTLEELEKIRFSNDTLHIETLLVLQRILGTTNSTALDSIMYRGVIFAREKRYEHSLLFSLYVMEIRKSIGESLQLLLSSVVNVFSDMMMHKVDIPCDTLIRAMKYAIEELMENELSSFNSSFESTLHLIVIISKVGATAVLLTETGVDVNATDMQRNTPLHVISSSRHADITDITVIINSLVAYGAHIDTLNNLGMTPIECIDTTRSDIRTLLKSQTKLSLKCISARIIVEYKIEYDSHVSKALAEFIQHHS
ncbi:unnamed protein product [Didymodactylos carnosus]|uniref:Protein fem-1 homolog B n=1 Tax=Didymodactylos carnosus TaxID=1234261 RepID=A0A814M9J7_9BILA|nr:unnamed protein product [Didymodactylos carnosus]CAF3840432.1 unnamed protein product [Didymodactylos carnosus]